MITEIVYRSATDGQERLVTEMTYHVSSWGTLNFTYLGPVSPTTVNFNFNCQFSPHFNL